jgi:hypothetical protein
MVERRSGRMWSRHRRFIHQTIPQIEMHGNERNHRARGRKTLPLDLSLLPEVFSFGILNLPNACLQILPSPQTKLAILDPKSTVLPSIAMVKSSLGLSLNISRVRVSFRGQDHPENCQLSLAYFNQWTAPYLSKSVPDASAIDMDD